MPEVRPQPSKANATDASLNHLLDLDEPEDEAQAATYAAYNRPSKSELKRQSHDLQEIGRQLLEMPDRWVAQIEMPDRLREALEAYRTTRSFEGKRRQLQFIGKVIRGVDAEPLKEAVAAYQLGHARDALSLHEAENWRVRFLADEKPALDAWLLAHPDTDIQAMRSLIRQARKDAASQPEETAPGQVVRHGRAYRELFQIIKQALKQADAGSALEDDSNPTDADD
jgi:ribosome-associated protein